jgi:hypothetical protein
VGIVELAMNENRHIAKASPQEYTTNAKKLLQRGSYNVFNNEATMIRVAQTRKWEFTGIIRNPERYGLYFAS